ncbi:MAG: methylmalonyl-CoA mutase family protein [Geminicoccaceae bacterium]
MEAALAGIIQEAIAATAAARLERIATNREPVIGVSSFPRLTNRRRQRKRTDMCRLPIRHWPVSSR